MIICAIFFTKVLDFFMFCGNIISFVNKKKFNRKRNYYVNVQQKND